MARRIPISLRRSVARASSRLARFTHASNRTSAPTTARTPESAEIELRMSGMNNPGVMRRTPRPAFSAGIEPGAARFDLLRHHHRHPILGREGHFGSDKTLRRDANDGKCMIVERQFPADYGWITGKSFFPTRVA